MNKFVIFVLYLLVSLIHLSSGQWRHMKPLMEFHNLDWQRCSHSKFQLPHNHNFIRGRAPTSSISPIMRTTKPPTDYPNKNDPCALYDPPLPNFSAPGRRISDVKCFEYIWQIKVREDKSQRKQNCISSRSNFPTPLSVVGGHSTFRGEYPNMGAIGWKAVVGTWKFLCGCSLISSKYVLTAAHCTGASERDTTIADPVPKIVRLGDKNIAGKDEDPTPYIVPVDVEIVNIIVHPNYKSPKKYYDIALMELIREMTFSIDIQPACLWAKNKFNNITAEVAGWGVTELGSKNTSSELLAAEVDIFDSAKCRSLLQNICNRNWCGLEDHQLCAGKLDGSADACQGDSGGPLSVKIPLPVTTQGTMHFILGVTSFGSGCGIAGLPGVYTSVPSFVDWIEQVVWPEL